jgi:hypothetical protein
MTTETVPVPLWLLWTRIACVVLSLVGIAVHYNLRVKGRLRAKHAVVRFFVKAARESRLDRIRLAAAIATKAMQSVYGANLGRIVPISLSLSAVYLLGAFFWSGGSSYDWNGARSAKQALEKSADPTLFATPRSEVQRARTMDCVGDEHGAVCTPHFTDPQAEQTRTRLDRFPARYRALVAASPQKTAITMLTLWDGTYADIPFDRLVARASLILFGVLVDLLGVFLVFQALGRLSKSTSFFGMITLGVMTVFCSSALMYGTLYAYELVSNGDEMGIAAVLAALFAPLILLFGIALLCATSSSESRDDLFITIALKIIAPLGALVCAGMLGYFAWDHLVRIHIGADALAINRPPSAFFGLVALGTVLPTLMGAVCVVVAAGAFARALLYPTMVYVRTALRLPTPLIITLTGAPIAVAQALISGWSDLCRMLGVHSS